MPAGLAFASPAPVPQSNSFLLFDEMLNEACNDANNVWGGEEAGKLRQGGGCHDSFLGRNHELI